MSETRAIVFGFSGVIAKPIEKGIISSGDMAEVELYDTKEVMDSIIRKYGIGITTGYDSDTVWRILLSKRFPFGIQIIGSEKFKYPEDRLEYTMGVVLRAPPSETVCVYKRASYIKVGINKKVKRIIIPNYSADLGNDLEKMMERINSNKIETNIVRVNSPKEILDYIT